MKTSFHRRGPALEVALLLLGACGGGEATAPSGSSVALSPDVVFLVGAGSTMTIQATVVGGLPVAWTSADPAVATVDEAGLVTAVATGTTAVTARSGTASAVAQVEVWAPATVDRYEPGVSYFGRARYVEYVPGELPVVISAPHGGAMTPSEIPDRVSGTTVTDVNTVETARAVRDALVLRTGKAPHLIISHLKRTKLDPNREIVEAAQGNPYAENAWSEFQGYIDVAEELVTGDFGSGLYLDLHGHGHEIPRVELGYLLGASVPSPATPSPGADEYFSGGYDTDRHGSRHGGTVSGIQMELQRPGIRDTDESRRAFGAGLAAAVEAYLLAHWGFFADPPP